MKFSSNQLNDSSRKFVGHDLLGFCLTAEITQSPGQPGSSKGIQRKTCRDCWERIFTGRLL